MASEMKLTLGSGTQRNAVFSATKPQLNLLKLPRSPPLAHNATGISYLPVLLKFSHAKSCPLLSNLKKI